MKIETILKNHPIIAILRNVDDEILPYYVESILDGGIHAGGIARNTSHASEQIKLLREKFGNDLLVGAGTSITKKRIESAREAGACFFLTPSVTKEILEYYVNLNLPVLPGVFSPSDVHLCLKYKIHTMKLFPACELPLSYIQSLKGPFENTNYVAVGGVSIDNLPQIFQAGFIGAGIGSNLIPQSYIEDKNWRAAAEHVRQYKKTAENLKSEIFFKE